jgi:DNA-binding NtrC family response regulator
MSRILIVDDEKNTREGLARALSPEHAITLADSAEAALSQLAENQFDLVLTDLKMPGLTGLELLERLQELDNPPQAIMLTAYGSIETAVAAMQAGAVDFLTKPINLDSLEMVISRALENRALRQENAELKRALAEHVGIGNMIGSSNAMRTVSQSIRQVAPARTTVLITGESGTGKELAARAIHDLSDRANQPFLAVHCAALPANLLASELFGHEKGAFTGAQTKRIGRFEAADGGTLFLDEIGEIDPQVQVMLLRFLETRTFERLGGHQPVPVNVRLVAATNRDLRSMVDEGTFREDLYFRLDVVQIRMPALRERREDVPLLLHHFLETFNRENNRQVKGFSPAALDALTGYDWPGNVRELRNCVERLVVMTPSDLIDLGHLPEKIRSAAGTATVRIGSDTLDIHLNEKLLVEQALEASKGNRTEAAKRLGISRRTLHRKLNEYGLR